MNRPIEIKITLNGQEIDTVVLEKHCVLIGREPGADILLDHPAVSPQHASIELGPGTIRIRDLLSSTETFVNGESISWVDVQDGDVIRVGGFDLHVTIPRTAGAGRARSRGDRVPEARAAREASNPPPALPRQREGAWEDGAVIDQSSWLRPGSSRRIE